MALMIELIEIEPSSFEEATSQPFWVEAIVGKYESILKNNEWEVVLIPEEKSMVGSRWIYKVKH